MAEIGGRSGRESGNHRMTPAAGGGGLRKGNRLEKG